MTANPMAANAHANTAMDYEAHVATYHLFTNMIKWGLALVVLFLILLAYFTL